MSKKKDLFRKKLELLSELSVDNVVNISEKGNYFVNLESFSTPYNIIKKKFDFNSITKNTISNLFTEKEIKIPHKGNILLLNKQGKLYCTHRNGGNKYKTNFKFNQITLSNYWKYNYFPRGKYNFFIDLVYLNKKCAWLKDKSYAHSGLHLLKQYSSLNEFKKHLGYSFLTDKRFEGLFNNYVEQDNKVIYHDFNQSIIELLILGKLTTEQSRKFIVINILEMLFEENTYSYLNIIKKTISDNFDAFKKGLVIQNTCNKTINYGQSIQSTQEDDEDLPF